MKLHYQNMTSHHKHNTQGSTFQFYWNVYLPIDISYQMSIGQETESDKFIKIKKILIEGFI